MIKLLKSIIAVILWLYLIASCAALWVIASMIWIFTVLFDRKRIILHKFACFWGFHYLQIIPSWRVTFNGREKIDDISTCIFAANHQSMMDILVLFGLNTHFKWVAKRSLFGVPFLGWNMWFNNYVGIRRGKLKSIKLMYADCDKHLSQGSSLFFFPEGTRSEDGQLHEFKQGPFKLAIKHNVPVVPIAIDGVRDILAKSAWILPIWKKIDISVNILDPIYPAEAENKIPRLLKTTREKIHDKLESVRSD